MGKSFKVILAILLAVFVLYIVAEILWTLTFIQLDLMILVWRIKRAICWALAIGVGVVAVYAAYHLGRSSRN